MAKLNERSILVHRKGPARYIPYVRRGCGGGISGEHLDSPAPPKEEYRQDHSLAYHNQFAGKCIFKFGLWLRSLDIMVGMRERALELLQRSVVNSSTRNEKGREEKVKGGRELVLFELFL